MAKSKKYKRYLAYKIDKFLAEDGAIDHYETGVKTPRKIILKQKYAIHNQESEANSEKREHVSFTSDDYEFLLDVIKWALDESMSEIEPHNDLLFIDKVKYRCGYNDVFKKLPCNLGIKVPIGLENSEARRLIKILLRHGKKCKEKLYHDRLYALEQSLFRSSKTKD